MQTTPWWGNNVEILAAVVAQQVIGRHSWCFFSDKFGDLGVLVV